jgi:hypothetical protein
VWGISARDGWCVPRSKNQFVGGGRNRDTDARFITEDDRGGAQRFRNKETDAVTAFVMYPMEIMGHIMVNPVPFSRHIGLMSFAQSSNFNIIIVNNIT